MECMPTTGASPRTRLGMVESGAICALKIAMLIGQLGI